MASEVVRAYRPGARCPAGWVDADGLVRVTLARVATAPDATMVNATIRGGAPLTTACAGEVEPELTARGLIQLSEREREG